MRANRRCTTSCILNVYSLDLFSFRIYISVASETGKISDRHGGMELSFLLDKTDFYIAKAKNETYFEHLSMIENSARKYLRRSLPFLKRWKQLTYTKNISKDSNNLTMIMCLMNV